eukprot:scaffold278943_cov43-Prasinocladus_malaysianus.AAC.1
MEARLLVVPLSAFPASLSPGLNISMMKSKVHRSANDMKQGSTEVQPKAVAREVCFSSAKLVNALKMQQLVYMDSGADLVQIE